MMPGADTWLYAPYQILALRNVRNTGTAKPAPQTFATCKRTTPQQLHLKWELRREKSCTNLVPRYATIARGLNVVKRTWMDTEFCMTLLARKKWNRFQKERCRSAVKHRTFSNISYLAPKVFQQLRMMLFLKKLLYYSFHFTTIESEESIAKSSRTI